ncbi:GerW family sporulation protein [Kyrpidia tusciae]|uniref:Sporulation protein YtfJ n=1 Tax=Kyrpidia tusciae (strain DSM 2912 / NBRC 15312 / T2) TaxID=562970 RepID=D5WRV4_KYRT2|nr:spore germination protein GerW family protein [Kyrpidia tusciae]ADG06906.1 Sporulation protein YtfJ [Kyrpidia tusciae DSM 2912]MBE3552801.1 sporulation protein [Kyrpidia tusciae]
MFKETVDAIVAHLENLVNTKTVIGEPITAGNTTLIPVVSASFGFGGGGGQGNEPEGSGGTGSGGGAGAKLTPTALVVIRDDDVKVFSLTQKGALERLAELVPELASKINQFRKSPEQKS